MTIHNPYSIAFAGPIHDAVKSGDVAKVTAVLNANPALFNAEENKWTPLHCAASRGNINVIRALIAAGANTTIKENKGKTPSEFAILHGHSEVARLFGPTNK
jgi:ankyrin repeat protein